MNSNFETAMTFVFKVELGENGELVANDKGGYTKFGISSASNPDVDVPGLTKEGAKLLYRERYWNACHCDELPFPLSVAVFDAAVNQGEGTAKRMLQISLGVLVDGILGEKTISAAFKAPEVSLLKRFMAQRMARYARTILNDPPQEVFISNWSNRLMELAEIVFNRAALS